MLHVLRTGCAWRQLPHDLTVSWPAAHTHFPRWCLSGTWAPILTTVCGQIPTRSRRHRRPTAAVADSSSVKACPVAGPRGFHGANKIHGVKRHVLVASVAVPVAAVVTPADVGDRAAFATLLRNTKRIAPSTSHVRVDKDYTGPALTTAASRAGVTVDAVSGPKPGHRFIDPPRRRVIEPTNGWINHCRPIDRHHETTPIAHEGFLHLSQIALLLHRLDRSQLFDTL